MNFHNRQYDPQIGRFLSVDPLAVATKSFSSYAAMNNNPASTVDPLGLTGIGIISWVGYAPTRMDQMLMMSPSVSMDQLGMTDDLRNYNEKIVAAAKAREQARETKQHASTQAWTGESPFSSGSSVCNLFPTEVPSANEVYGVVGGSSDGDEHWGPDKNTGKGENANKSESVAWDLDGDGKLSLSEARNWRKNGLGKSIEVDASKVNIGYVDTRGLEKDQHIYVNLSANPALSTSSGVVYGQLELIYNGAGGFSIVPNMYDFDIGADQGHPWSQEPGRNAATAAGRMVSGWNGTDYMINFRGTVTPSAPHWFWGNSKGIRFPGQ
jgi:uncharacterized protein RhaS with RHS repeats